MRTIHAFNHGWLFAPRALPLDADDSLFQRVTLPHTNTLLPHHNFDNADYQFISTYRKRFHLPERRAGRLVMLDFDGAMTAATVWINGTRIGEHAGGYVPFSFDCTPYLHDDSENVIHVELDSFERPDIPPNGYVVDYLTFGGIYRDVSLRLVDPTHIADFFAKPRDVLSAPKLDIDVRLRNLRSEIKECRLRALLTDAGDHGFMVETPIFLPAYGDYNVTLEMPQLHDLRLWTPDDPHRYTLTLSLFDGHGTVDSFARQIGFREAQFRDDGFYLNGNHLFLRGLNRHQTYPYIGSAAPARLQRKDADILKDELGVNIVRTSHYPQSHHFLDRCDEIGLLVFEEIPGWQFIGDNDWKALVLRDVEAMITRDRHHPSIILWGVRVNESPDDDQLYAATNDLAHRLDPTRQTGGVRNFLTSKFLEDVFTYNDFSNSIVEPPHTPYMVSEFNGHMFPTKTWDNELKQIEHALRHARVQDKALSVAGVSGAIGWCAFDYNTHRDLGSGDRICYHGVSDIFRLPKFAADFYASQGVKTPFVRAATFWTMGDRDEGGNDPLWVFSNCSEIEVYIGDEREGRYQPERAAFPNLPHPPFRVPYLGLINLWGVRYQDIRIVGLIDGQPAAEQRIAADGLPAQLMLTADDSTIHADGIDMTRVVVKIADKYGNRLPYATSVISFTLVGDGSLIGENPFPLVGGQAALYVKAGMQPGTLTLTARVLQTYGRALNPVTITITTS
jgi:beta-galactosidase